MKKGLDCIIVDDEPLALDILEEYVHRTPGLTLAGRFTSGVEALKALNRQAADISFVDIQMPGLDGIELSRLAEGKTKIIFTTAFPQYALEGFKVDALDYLLKPISYAEFTRALLRAESWYEMKNAAEGTPAAAEPHNLVVKSDYKQFVVPIDTISYIEGIRDYICIHTDEGDIRTLMSLKTVEEMLPSNQFARVHRSYIVNVDRVKKIERTRIVFGDVPIPISDTYKAAFLKLLASRTL